MKYKALMLDIDGTLARSQEKTLPTEHVRNTIHKAKNKIHIGVATGRPLLLVEEIVNHLDLSGPCIINDGGIVLDINTKEIYYERLLSQSEVAYAIKILTEHKIPLSVHDNNKDFRYSPSLRFHKPVNIFTDGVHENIADSAIEQLKQLPTLHVTKYTSWINGQTGVLIAHTEATKQHGILEVAKALTISTDEIIGVGDGYNDFPLLMACGLKIAMGNAVTELKEIADYIAPSVDDDGVAHVIEKFILNS